MTSGKITPIIHTDMLSATEDFDALEATWLLLPDSISFLLYTAEAKIRFCQEFKNQENIDLPIFLRLVFEAFPSLTSRKKAYNVFWAGSGFLTLPDKFVEKDDLLYMARVMIYEYITEEEVAITPIEPLEISCLYWLPQSVTHILESYLNSYQVKHIAFSHIRLGQKIMAETPTFILAHLWNDQLMLTVYANRKLVLCNAYAIRSVVDINYFILAAKKSIRLPGRIPILCLGTVDPKETYYKQIQSMIPGVYMLDQWQQYLEEDNPGIQAWKFAYAVV